MHKLLVVVLLLLSWSRTFAQDSSPTDQYPNAPDAELPIPRPLPLSELFAQPNPAPSSIPQHPQLSPHFDLSQSRTPYPSPEQEPYHWKGLILQSVEFSALENGVRIAFYQSLAAQQMVEMRTRLSELAKDAVETTQQLFNVGQADQPDLLQAQVEADEADLAVTAAQQNQ